jgi:hypothetical protein
MFFPFRFNGQNQQAVGRRDVDFDLFYFCCVNEPFVHSLPCGKRVRSTSGGPNELSAGVILPVGDRQCQYYFACRRLRFHKRSQLFIRVHNETLFRSYDRATVGVLVAVGAAVCVAVAVAVDVANAVAVAVGRGVAVAVAVTVAVAVAVGFWSQSPLPWLLRLANH